MESRPSPTSPTSSISPTAAWAKRYVLIGLALASLSAHGLELGAVQMLSGLGQPLSLQLPLRWAPGEARHADCLKLRVEAGERALGVADLQQTLLKGDDAHSALLWLRSKVAVTEPLLMLSLGCPAQQVMALVDPLPLTVAPAAGIKVAQLAPPQAEQTAPASASRASIPNKPRPAQKNLLRLSGASLPPLTMADAEAPGLRWRFDSDLETDFRPVAAAKDQPFYVRPGAPGASLLMAIDVGRPAGPADRLMAQEGAERLQRAQAQFTALQAEHRALKLALDKLTADLAARDAAAAKSGQRGLIALAAGVAALALVLVYLLRRRRDIRPISPKPANISA